MLEKHWNRMSLGVVAAVFAAVACSSGDNAGGDTATDSGSVSAGTNAPAASAVDPSMVTGFLRTVDSHEVEAGKVAQTKATNAQVKEFARMMVTDHCRSLTTAAAPTPGTPGAPDSAKRTSGSTSANTAECDRIVASVSADSTGAASGPAAQGGADMQQMRQTHQQEMQTLNSTAKGAKFDSTYMAAMVSGHQTVLQKLESMRGTGGSASSATGGTAANPGTGSTASAGSPNTTQPAGTANQGDPTQTQLQNAITMVRTHLDRAQEIQRALQGSGK